MSKKCKKAKQEKIRKMFLDDLPRFRFGKSKSNGELDWKNCKGHKVKGIYDDIKFEVEIVDYYPDTSTLKIKYKNNEFEIYSRNFLKCMMGIVLKKITNEFKVEVGTNILDEKRNIIIIDTEYRIDKCNNQNQKWYKYKCNKCGYEGWIIEGSLVVSKSGCSCCNNKVVAEGINDIPTTAPWMVKFFQGGYDEAKLYNKSSGKKIKPICPDCGRVKDKEIQIGNIYKAKSISCICGDGIKYPEKFMFNILEQLGLVFQTQLTKTTFEWCEKYKYDFYFELNGEGYIIETHGLQHYEDAWAKLKKTQENDKIKKELALSNGIKEENYIVIDCRESDSNWIKNNILNSKLNDIFDLSIINWDKVEEFSLKSRVKEACELKRDNPEMSNMDIGKIMKLNKNTIYEYLKKGSKIWDWCNYNSKEEKTKSSKINGLNSGKRVEIFKDCILLGIFESASELARQSEKLLGTVLNCKGISMSCNKKCNYKGFTFKYVEKSNNKQNITESA